MRVRSRISITRLLSDEIWLPAVGIYTRIYIVKRTSIINVQLSEKDYVTTLTSLNKDISTKSSIVIQLTGITSSIEMNGVYPTAIHSHCRCINFDKLCDICNLSKLCVMYVTVE